MLATYTLSGLTIVTPTPQRPAVTRKCPPGWDKACLALLKHDLPYVAQTLAHLPRPLPASILPAIGPYYSTPTRQFRIGLS